MLKKYDFLVECVRSGLVDGESFSEALTNFDKYSDDNEPKVSEILTATNKSLDDLKVDVQEFLDMDDWRE